MKPIFCQIIDEPAATELFVARPCEAQPDWTRQWPPSVRLFKTLSETCKRPTLWVIPAEAEPEKVRQLAAWTTEEAKHRLNFWVIDPVWEDLALEALDNGLIDYFLPHQRPKFERALAQSLQNQKSQTQLTENFNRLTQAFDMVCKLSSDFLYTIEIDPKTGPKIDWVSESYTQTTGYSLAELQQTGFGQSIVAKESLQKLQDRMHRVIAGHTVEVVIKMVFRDGKYHYIQDRIYPIKNPVTGRIEKLFGLAKDITAQVEAEQELKTAMQRYAAISEMTSDFIYTMAVDAHGGYAVDWVSQSYLSNNGYHKEEVNNRGFMDGQYHTDDLPAMFAAYQKFLSGEQAVMEFRITYRDGSEHWLRNVMRPTKDPKTGKVNRGVGASKDITLEKNASLALAESEERFRTLVEASPDVIFIITPNGDMQYANPASYQKLGVSSNPCFNILDEYARRRPSSSGRMDWLREQMSQGKKVQKIRLQWPSLNGTLLFLEGDFISYPIQGKDSKGVVGYFRDVTERALARQRARELEARLGLILNNFSEPIWAYDAHLKLIFYNLSFEKAAAAAHYSIPQIGEFFTIPFEISTRDAEGEDWTWRWITYLTRALQGEKLTIEYSHRKRQNVIYYEMSINPLVADNKVEGIFIMRKDVTERKSWERRLRKVKANLHALIENYAEAVWTIETDGQLGLCNAAFVQLFTKYSAGTNPKSPTVPDFLDHFRSYHERALAGERVLTMETFKSFEPVAYYEFTFAPIYENDEIIGASAFGRNVTHQRIQDLELRKKNEVFEFSRDPIFITENFRITDCNQAAIEMFGLPTKEHLDNVRILQFSPPVQPNGDRSEIALKKHIEQILSRSSYTYDWRFIDHSGREIDCEALVTRIVFEGRELISAVYRNVTERKKQEEVIRRSEAQLSALINNTTDAIWVFDREMNLALANQSFFDNIKRWWGEKLTLGQKLDHLRPLSNIDYNIRLWDEYLRRAFGGEQFSVDFGDLVGDSELFFELSFNPIRQQNEITGVSIFARDITSKVLAERAVRQSEANLSVALRSLQDAIWSVDRQGRLVHFNPVFAQRFRNVAGFSPEKEMNLTQNLIQKKRIARLRSFIQNARLATAGQEISCENIFEIDGESCIIESTFYPIRDADGEIQGVVVNSRDVTQKRALEAERREQERRVLNAVIQGQDLERKRIAEELHDGLAQYLLAARLNLSSIAQTTQCLGPNEKAGLEKVNVMLQETMEELRNISHDLTPRLLEDFGLAHALKNMCERMSVTRELEVRFFSNLYEVELPTHFQASLFRIVQEALSNIVKHARATQVDVQLTRRNAALLLMIEDDGVGLPPNLNWKNSPGLGLSNIYTRAQLLGGELFIDSQPGHGVTLTVELTLPNKN